MRAFSALLAVLVLIASGGCVGRIFDPQLEEVSRARSSDGVVEALLVRGNTGATDPFSYSVYLVPSGMRFDPKSPRFRIERALFTADYEEGLELAWKAPKFLEIRFGKARIHRFTNFWQAPEVHDFKYVVELRLVPTDEASSLGSRGTPNQAMQPTSSKPAIYGPGVCHRTHSPRASRVGLAVADLVSR